MIINKIFRVSWVHYNRDMNLPLTLEQIETKIVEIMVEDVDKFSTQKAIIDLIEKEKNKPLIKSHSKCIIERLHEESNIWVTNSTGLGIVHPKDTFNRKKGILVSFDDAVSKIEGRAVRTMLWDAFWKAREPKREVLRLTTDRDRHLRAFLEETAKKKIEGKHIIYTLPEATEIYFPRND